MSDHIKPQAVETLQFQKFADGKLIACSIESFEDGSVYVCSEEFELLYEFADDLLERAIRQVQSLGYERVEHVG